MATRELPTILATELAIAAARRTARQDYDAAHSAPTVLEAETYLRTGKRHDR